MTYIKFKSVLLGGLLVAISAPGMAAGSAATPDSGALPEIDFVLTVKAPAKAAPVVPVSPAPAVGALPVAAAGQKSGGLPSPRPDGAKQMPSGGKRLSATARTAGREDNGDGEFYQLASARGKDAKLTGVGRVRFVPLNDDYLVVVPAAQAVAAAGLFAQVKHEVLVGQGRVYYLCSKRLFGAKSAVEHNAVPEPEGGQ